MQFKFLYANSKGGCFYRYFHILKPKTIDCLFQSKYIQSVVIDFHICYNSNIAGEKQKGDFPLINHC